MTLKVQDNQLLVPQEIIDEIVEITEAKRIAEIREKELKQAILKAMEDNGVKSFKSEYLDITYIEPTETVTIDHKKLEQEHPEVYIECVKKSKRSAYVKLTVR